MRRAAAAAAAAAAPEFTDYYAVLDVGEAASAGEIKRAYRALAKACHPDVSGEAGHAATVALNEAYRVLSAQRSRREYDRLRRDWLADFGAAPRARGYGGGGAAGPGEEAWEAAVAAESRRGGAGSVDWQDPAYVNEDYAPYTGEPLSEWAWDGVQGQAIFVDELSCVGCRNCVNIAPGVFEIESENGFEEANSRARVHTQWPSGTSGEDIEGAILSCPVDCIHEVNREELPALEYCIRHRVRGNSCGLGNTVDIFAISRGFLKEREDRKRRIEELHRCASRRCNNPRWRARSGFAKRF